MCIIHEYIVPAREPLLAPALSLSLSPIVISSLEGFNWISNLSKFHSLSLRLRGLFVDHRTFSGIFVG